MGQCDTKLVAAKTSDNVTLADIVEQGLRHMLDDFVARGMTESVIDQFEPIEIDEYQTKRCAIA